MSVPQKEIGRWKETFPVLLFMPDHDIARLIVAVKEKLEPSEREEAHP